MNADDAGWQAPYFFLSYAETPTLSPTATRDTGVGRAHAQRLYQLLCADLLELTTMGSTPGFMNVDIRLGNRWEPALHRALATCRVFVPLYSPRYFLSPWCGKEWDAWTRRQHAHWQNESDTRSAIVPVLWTDTRSMDLPACVEALQYTGWQTSEAYLAHGLFGLKITANRQYRKIVHQLARTIRDVAEQTALPPCDVNLFADLRNAFREGSA